ncbi:DUF885 domain-containing protein [Colwellia sp. 75C3]|uniref:DUF885 domain-containing protein n=1 Tax=Colwellia sp. 75C3 TaxID=888425 RepID=UPI000C32E835|nr:DUF885 domain-containing protein [Colwellia sp. 75C3]PKG83305.1 DUF885 domain-containing protein [Colwellia sp. 75C3]
MINKKNKSLKNIRGLCIVLSTLIFAPNLMADDKISLNADKKLEKLIAQHWDYSLKESPMSATSEGITTYNHLLNRVSKIDNDRRLAEEIKILGQLVKIDPKQLSASNRVNNKLFQWVIEDSIQGYQLNLSRIPLNTFYSFFLGVLDMGNGLPMNTTKDYNDYIARLNEIPRYFNENITNMREGIRTNFTLPKIVVEGILPTVQAQIYDKPTDSSLYKPFFKMSSRLSDKEKEELRESAKQAISQSAVPAFRTFAEFFGGEYLQAATITLGAEQMNNGKAYYAHQIKKYTTLPNITANEIHQTGLSEVKRIRAEMVEIIKETKFEGSFDEFTEYLRTDPQFYAKTPKDLLKEASYIAKRIDYIMPEFFKTLPRLPYGVVAVPKEIAPNYTTASYNSAVVGGTRGGAYWLNTYQLDQRPLYELTALTLHESVPGHHHQSAISSELKNVPKFRLGLYFSAYGEGWGLYSEKLGVEMGLYDTPYDHFGRLSYEMWRACRLVIDTGIHAMKWSRQEGIDFLSSNTSLSPANVRAEVDRYISWPGQALSYKLGELHIWKLRKKAEKTLGEQFDLREFHDALLSNGALPLAMVEAEIDRFITLNKK